ncbi:MAG TPA: hypothetical protein VMO00_08250 [Methylomirabilota bacterium]|nr:hypothetical protein [Methylomirabilota bacterium]
MATAGLVLGSTAATCVLLIGIFVVGMLRHEQGIIKEADESSAVGTLRTMNAAAVKYKLTYQNGFPPNQTAFGGAMPGTCDAASLIIDMLAVNGGAQKSGYTITYTGGAALPKASPGCAVPGALTYTIHADPIRRGETGQRSFFTDETGVIRANGDGVAGKESSPIG